MYKQCIIVASVNQIIFTKGEKVEEQDEDSDCIELGELNGQLSLRLSDLALSISKGILDISDPLSLMTIHFSHMKMIYKSFLLKGSESDSEDEKPKKTKPVKEPSKPPGKKSNKKSGGQNCYEQ